VFVLRPSRGDRGSWLAYNLRDVNIWAAFSRKNHRVLGTEESKDVCITHVQSIGMRLD
jgi:hypothetical protein